MFRDLDSSNFFLFSFSLPVQRSSRWILSVSQKLVSSDPVYTVSSITDEKQRTGSVFIMLRLSQKENFCTRASFREGKIRSVFIIPFPFSFSFLLFLFSPLLFRINAVETGKDIFDATSNIVTQYSKDEKARDAWGVAPNVACEIDGLPRWKLIRVFTWTTSGSIESVTRPCE